MNFDFNKDLDSLIAAGAPTEGEIKGDWDERGCHGFEKKFYEQMLKLYQQNGGGYSTYSF